MKYFIWACLLGALSAVSLPLGSWFGIKFKFTSKQISILAAFGAGALLAALSVELIAPTTLALVGADEAKNESLKLFYSMIIGCVIGGLLYIILDSIVNKNGGFLRKTSTVLNHYEKLNKEEKNHILKKMSTFPLFLNFPPEHIETLMNVLEPVDFKDGEEIIKEGEEAEAAFIILEGTIEGSFRGERVQEFKSENLIVNLFPLLSNTPNLATGTARGEIKALQLKKEGFNKLRMISPEFDETCRKIAAERMESFEKVLSEKNKQVANWVKNSERALIENVQIPTIPSLMKMEKEHHGSPMAVWLGILLDGIPESVVIGAGMLTMLSLKLASGLAVGFVDVIPFTLVAGLFLSNFPEALSSSANMLHLGWSKKRIFLMWLSLMVITAVGAGIGYLAAGQISHTWMVLFEGIAAGAMLTMISAAMIPEAVFMGSGNAVGLSTLAGFLGAILFKLLE